MLYKLEATNVSFDESDEALSAGFGGLPDEDGHPTVFLLLSRSSDPDEDEPGIAGVYVEWCDQANSCYGCIEQFALERRGVRVTFTPEAGLVADLEAAQDDAANQLTELLITFTIDERRYEELRDKLSDILFVGCEQFTVAT